MMSHTHHARHHRWVHYLILLANYPARFDRPFVDGDARYKALMASNALAIVSRQIEALDVSDEEHGHDFGTCIAKYEMVMAHPKTTRCCWQVLSKPSG